MSELEEELGPILYTPTTRKKPGPKGPSQALIDAIVELKQRNPRYACPRIAQQISNVFGIEIDKDVVRRAGQTLSSRIGRQ